MQKLQALIDALEEMEQLAYEGSCGESWLSDLGDRLKMYLNDCLDSGKTATFPGLVKYAKAVFDASPQDYQRIRTKIKNGDSTATYHSLSPYR